jgi:hypothetical protein
MTRTSQPITIAFDNPPVIGKQYQLTGLIGVSAGETAVATLVNLVPHEEVVTLPSGRHETYHDVHAIFETDDGRKFKRVVLPELE